MKRVAAWLLLVLLLFGPFVAGFIVLPVVKFGWVGLTPVVAAAVIAGAMFAAFGWIANTLDPVDDR